MLRLEEVCFGYPSGFQIRGIDLEIPAGRFFALLGPNGSGKSTLVKLISHLVEPEAGKVSLEGLPMQSYSPRELARRMAVIASENYFEFPFRVLEVVEMGRFPHLGRFQRLSTQDREIVRNAIHLTEIAEFVNRRISELSSGERQRVLLARAIAQQPSLLLLDEPSAHLDIRHQISTFRLLRRLNREQGMTIVVVLHDLTIASVFCDTVAVMHEGRIVEEGPPRSVVTTEMIREVYGADVLVRHTKEGVPVLSYAAARPDSSRPRNESPRTGD